MYTDNPIEDFLRHDAEQADELEKFPVCDWCGENIQQETAVVIDGNWFCDDCLDNHLRRSTRGD